MSDYLALARAFVAPLDEGNERDEQRPAQTLEHPGGAPLSSSDSSTSSHLGPLGMPWLEDPPEGGLEHADRLICPTARALPLGNAGARTAATWAATLDRLEPDVLAAFVARHMILKAAVRDVLYRRALAARARQLGMSTESLIRPPSNSSSPRQLEIGRTAREGTADVA